MKQQIRDALPENHPWAESIHYFDCVDSTNDRAKELARTGAPHGTVLIANRQTHGRGRMGRSFESPKSMGIYMSVILRPDCSPEQLMHLTCAVATAVCDAVEYVSGLRPGVKWINDLVLNRRKLGGILTELALHPTGKVQYAIVGIGINCCQKPEDFPESLRPIAISLETATGQPASRPALAAAMIHSLEAMSGRLLSHKAEIMGHYRQDCITLGHEVQFVRDGKMLQGIAQAIDHDGALQVLIADGQILSIAAGEVSVRGLYGYC